MLYAPEYGRIPVGRVGRTVLICGRDRQIGCVARRKARNVRADACFAKAGEAASSFHARNTLVLKHSLHDATQKQREEMCVYADTHFGDIAQKLKCE